MKAKLYAVTVQYGAGFHYFVHYSDSLEDATRVRNEQVNAVVKPWEERRGKKGTRPRVMLWKRIDEGEGATRTEPVLIGHSLIEPLSGGALEGNE